MRYRVLGTLQVEQASIALPVSQPKSRALLGLLLARANRSVPSGELIEDLWLGSPPASAAGALRVHVTNLRRVLEVGATDPGVIESVASGYRITVPREDVDALAFEDAIRAARDAADAGSAAEVAEILEPALEWWRGPAYADLLQYFPIAAEAVRVNDTRLEAVELLADAHLALDRPRRVAEMLAPFVEAEPMRESLVERLMLSLYRSGRASEALRVFSQLREALDSELGVGPGPSARALRDAIVLQQPELELAQGPRRPTPRIHPRANLLVGRRAELAALATLFESAMESESQLVFIRGPAGIGKSTLARLGAGRATDLGFKVLSGHCEPDPASDYEPFPKVVRAALADLDRDASHTPLFDELRRLAPDIADVLPAASTAVDGTAGRHRLFAAVNLLLTERSSPTLLVVEDLHWARRDALALLSHLVRESEGRLVVIATFRHDPGSYPVLQEALSQGRLGAPDLTIALDGLDIPELTALVRLVAEEPVRSRLLTDISELRELTGGNPLYIREVVRTLTETPGDTPLEDLAPGGVRELAQQRLQRLSPGAREALVVSSVLGRQFSLHLLAATLRVSENETLDAIDEALAVQLLDDTDQLDRFAFHPLIRNAIYVTTPASRRARLHLRAAEAVEAEFPTTESHGWAELARHLVAARPLSDPRRTASACRNAGDDAAKRFAHDEAITWYRDALALEPDANLTDHEVGSLQLALGVCLEATGQRNEARDMYLAAAKHAEVADDPILLADVAIAATPRYIAVDEFERPQLALIDRALPGASDDPRRLAWLLSSASAGRYYEDADGPYAERARRLARSSTDPEVRATGLLTYHRWLTHDPSAAEERLALSLELRDLCVAEHLDSLFGRVQRGLLTNLMGLGRFDDFDAQLEVFARYAQTNRAPGDLYWTSAHRAARQLMISPDGETEELINAARTLGRKLEQADAEGTFILQNFALRYQQNRAPEVVPTLDVSALPHPRIIAGTAVLAATFAAVGHHEPALHLLDGAVRNGEVVLPRDNLWLAATALYGAVASEIGTPEQRAVIERALAPFAEHWCVFGAGGAVVGTGHHWLARLAEANGDGQGAQRHFARAAEMSEDARSPYWMAQARERLVGDASNGVDDVFTRRP